ncbi:MAG: hypothetical protein J6D29_07325 [Solobacterium sp.]|nr:hypothetical protein [Solobacterium sp.]
MKIRSAKAKEGKRGGLLIKKLYSLIVAVILLLSLAGCTQATKTTMQPRLVKTVTEYNVDFETKEWIPVRTYDFTYENGYPVSIDVFEIGADLHTITNFAYTFENGIPTNRKTYNEEGTLLSETEYLNGRVYNVYEENEMGTDSLFYQYGNGDEYFTMVLRDARSVNLEMDIADFAEEVDSIAITVQNGLLVKTINTGMYANWGGEEEKEWLRFSGTYTAEYDKDGIVSVASVVHRVGPSGIEAKYELTKENGLVSEAISRIPSGEEDWYENAQFKFEYTDIETTPARYAQMINSFLMGSASSYYKYNWY